LNLIGKNTYLLDIDKFYINKLYKCLYNRRKLYAGKPKAFIRMRRIRIRTAYQRRIKRFAKRTSRSPSPKDAGNF
jgi:hypothetical protein